MKRRDDRGSAALEAAVLAPPLLAILVVIAVSGRIGIAHQSVDSAAAAGARAASIARTKSQADSAARSVVNDTLANQGVTCLNLQVTTDRAGFDTPVGREASVEVTVTCQVNLSDLVSGTGVPGSVTLSGTASSPLDQFRERQP